MARILVVDDNPQVSEIIISYLAEQGYEVTTASNGLEGLGRFQAGPYDIVLLDIMMPRMNGWQCLEAIRAVSRIPVIMMSANGQADDVTRSVELGADHFLAKPVSLEEVGALIRATLGKGG